MYVISLSPGGGCTGLCGRPRIAEPEVAVSHHKAVKRLYAGFSSLVCGQLAGARSQGGGQARPWTPVSSLSPKHELGSSLCSDDPAQCLPPFPIVISLGLSVLDSHH